MTQIALSANHGLISILSSITVQELLDALNIIEENRRQQRIVTTPLSAIAPTLSPISPSPAVDTAIEPTEAPSEHTTNVMPVITPIVDTVIEPTAEAPSEHATDALPVITPDLVSVEVSEAETAITPQNATGTDYVNVDNSELWAAIDSIYRADLGDFDDDDIYVNDIETHCTTETVDSTDISSLVASAILSDNTSLPPTAPAPATQAPLPHATTLVLPAGVQLAPLAFYIQRPSAIREGGGRFYVVTVGTSVGIFYPSWNIVAPLVTGQPGAVYCRARSFEDAVHIFSEAYINQHVRII